MAAQVRVLLDGKVLGKVLKVEYLRGGAGAGLYPDDAQRGDRVNRYQPWVQANSIIARGIVMRWMTFSSGQKILYGVPRGEIRTGD